MDLQPGITIGPYRVSREIGRGGMGVVCLAEDPRLDREVAIKVLPAHLAEDPARLERFENEARVLAQVNHPNVAGILGLEEKDGQRDLKPDNVRLTPEGKVKVLDFGLTRTDDGASSTSDDPAAAGGSTSAPTSGRSAWSSTNAWPARGRSWARRSATRSAPSCTRTPTWTEAGGWEPVSGTGEGQIRYPTFSPDARWLLFVSNESGEDEVLVKPFGRPGGSEQVPVGGGISPIWSDDGEHIYYRYNPAGRDDDWIVVVDVTETDGRLDFSRPRKLFKDDFSGTTPIRQWDMLGTDRFLLTVREGEDELRAKFEDLHPDRLIFIQNWASRLKTGNQPGR